MKGRAHRYTSAELAFVKRHCTLPRKKLHQRFVAKFDRHEVKEHSIKQLCLRNGWLTGRNGQYKQGHIPLPNAHAKGPNKGSFKKGQVSLNARAVGATRINVEGYIEIKTRQPRTWEQLHAVNWRTKNGPVPKGMCISFIDGDKNNTQLDNLELISRNVNLQINRLQHPSQSPELRQVIRTTGKLMAKTFERQAEA